MSGEEAPGRDQIEEILGSVRENPEYASYWRAYKELRRIGLDKGGGDDERKVRIGVLGSTNLDTLAMCLDIQCRLEGLLPEIYTSPFNQYTQDILDPDSQLHAFSPEIALLMIDWRSILPEDFPPAFPAASRRRKKREQARMLDHFRTAIDGLLSGTDSMVVAGNLIVPTFSPLGILDGKVDLGLAPFFAEINSNLCRAYSDNPRVFVHDLDAVAGHFGKGRALSPEMYYRGSILFAEAFLPVLSRSLVAYAKAYKNMNRKCMVLDLDNTLWGGVVGEDGMEGLDLGGSPVGRAYVDFQRLLLSYYNRGVILAINSKNNAEDAMKVLHEHPGMVLREKHFGAIRINWKDKTENMIELARELDIGLDSMIFIDDNPHERERVRSALPYVLVPELPSSPFRRADALKALTDLDVLVLTDEDRRRGEMYRARRQRRELMGSKGSLENFLRSLDLRIQVRPADALSLPRVASLLNRTNQFNMTTRRYTLAQVEEMSREEGIRIYTLKVRDRFGDEGIVGVAIIRAQEPAWIIDSFLMSCRVIGRGIEFAFMGRIAGDARAGGAEELVGKFIRTAKNEPARGFYADCGFRAAAERNGVARWVLDLAKGEVQIPDWVVFE